jgi:hypothetical protein
MPNNKSNNKQSNSKNKRGRKKKEPRKVVVEDDNIVKWIVENYNPSLVKNKIKLILPPRKPSLILPFRSLEDI